MMVDDAPDTAIEAEDASGDILFANVDWHVLEDGLEHRRTGYFIDHDALSRRRDGGLWEWPLHLAEKSWCSPRLFREAFLVALDRFGVARDAALAQSFATGFGLRPGRGGAARHEGFVALGDVVRPKPSPGRRQRQAVSEAHSPARRETADRPRVPVVAGG